MALQIWMPLISDVSNQGLSNYTMSKPSGLTFTSGGKLGNSATFNGSGSYTHTDGFSIGNVWTVCFWAKMNSNAQYALVQFGTAAAYVNSQCFIHTKANSNDNNLMLICNGANYTIDNVVYTNWFHCAITYDGSNLKAYINGSLKNTWTSTNARIAATRFIVGCYYTNGNLNANGRIQDVRVYDNALSPREVKEISKGLAVHYTLSGGAQNNLLTRTMKMEDWPFATARTSRTAGVGDFNQMVLVGSTADWSASCSCLTTRYHLVRGKQVTFSYYAKATASCSFCIDWTLCHYSNTQARYKFRDEYFTIGTEWKRYTVTRTIEDSFFTSTEGSDTSAIAPNADYFGIRFYLHTDNVTMYTYGWKLEYGSVATPWRPHPADPQYMAMGLFTGNRNLLVDSRKNQGKSLSTYDIGDYNLSESFVAGKTYTISARGNWSSDKKSYAFFLSGGSGGLVHWPTCCADGYMVGSFTATSDHASNTAGAGHGFIRVYISNNIGSYQGSTALSGTANVDWIKVEEGDIATGWTPNQSDSDYANQMIEYDTSGFNYNGVRYGGLKLSPSTARYTTSMIFSGVVNDYIQMVQSAYRILAGSNDAVTVSIWACKDNWGAITGTQDRMFASTEGGGFEICQPSNLCFVWEMAVGTTSFSQYYSCTSTISGTSFAAGSWHMFTGTFDGYDMKLYIDGVLNKTTNVGSSKTTIFNNPSATMIIGSEVSGTSPTSGYTFNGRLSDFRQYATALSAADILELYQTSASVASNGAMLANEFVE